jgi:hypothetical protein
VLLFSEDFEPELLLRAVRLNIPVIAPESNATIRFLEQEGRTGFGYHDKAECIAALLALTSRRAEIETTFGARAASGDLADYISAVLPSETFFLPADHPSI